MYQSTGTLTKYGVFLIIGFALGVIGIRSTENSPFSLGDIILSIKVNSPSETIASACMLPGANQEEEIFFLSCGGIF